MASEPMICCSWVTKGRVMQARVDRVDGVAPPVGGEVVAGHGVDPGPRVGAVECGGGLAHVGGGTAGWVKPLAMMPPVHSGAVAAATMAATAHPPTISPVRRTRAARALTPPPQEHGQAEDHQG